MVQWRRLYRDGGVAAPHSRQLGGVGALEPLQHHLWPGGVGRRPPLRQPAPHQRGGLLHGPPTPLSRLQLGGEIILQVFLGWKKLYNLGMRWPFLLLFMASLYDIFTFFCRWHIWFLYVFFMIWFYFFWLYSICLIYNYWYI